MVTPHSPTTDGARSWQQRRAARVARDAAIQWRFERAVARVRAVDTVIAEYATSICGRPVRRREVAPLASAVELPGVKWSIDADVVVEFLPGETGPGQLIVHDFALLKPLKKRLRTRHVAVAYSAVQEGGHVGFRRTAHW